MNEVQLCASCSAPIVFAVPVGGGKLNPVDAVASEKGNLRLWDDGTYQVVAADDLSLYRTSGVPLHTSHFATCPNAERHRRPRTKRGAA